MKGLSLAFLFCLGAYLVPAQIMINEICPANADIIHDTTFYEFTGWVELYNAGSSTVDLAGYYLSDKSSEPLRWRFPAGLSTIGPKGYLLIWCDKNDHGRHTNFSLDADGEEVILSNPSGVVVDQLTFFKQYVNVSYGRKSDGAAEWSYQRTATPNAPNAGGDAANRLESVTADPEAGIYTSQLTVTLSHRRSGVTIKYTLDGSEPNESSPIYSSPIALTKSTVIKAKAYGSVYIPSETIVHSYIISDRQFKLPVVSLSMDPKYLYDDMIGIYVEGVNGVPGRGTDYPVNWNQNWYRHTSFEYFVDQKLAFNQEVDLRVYGNYSRRRPQKSFAIKARDKYGNNSLDMKFFKNKPAREYGGFMLRNSGTDWNNTHFRDAFIHRIAADQLDLDYSDYQPTIVFLNGEYWGIQNLRERIEEDYMLSNYGVPEEELELMESTGTPLVGTNTAYRAYRDSLGRRVDRFDPRSIAFIERNIDVQSFINYQIHNIYAGNTDWPGNNVKFWRHTNGGKFRWLLYDCDAGFGADPLHPTIEWATAANSEIPHNRPSSTEHLRHLLDNPVFKQRFISSMITLIQTTYQSDRIVDIINEFENDLKDEMPFHKQRWGGSMSDWARKVQVLRDFATQRNPFMMQHAIDFFQLENPVDVDISIAPSNGGNVVYNGVKLKDSNTTLFLGLPINATAVPAPGFKFTGWTVSKKNSKTNVMIPYESEWKYFDKGSLPAANWMASDFNDATWSSGLGQFGYGENDENTKVSYGPSSSSKYPTTYFRKEINIENLDQIQHVSLSALFDDGVVVYLNGTEIFRRGMPMGTIGYETYANQANDNTIATTAIEKGLLIAGRNVIAAEVHQSSASSTDLSFDLEMIVTEIGDFETVTKTSRILSDTAFSDVTLVANFSQLNGVVINEFSANNSDFDDEFGESDDWIEIHNSGNTTVDIGGYYITDDVSNKMKHRIPTGSSATVLAPGAYLLLWADGTPGQGPTHLSFKLSEQGESIGLYMKDGDDLLTVDEVHFTSQPKNYSWSRTPNATGPFRLTPNTTPGASNSTVVGTEGREFDGLEVYPNPTDGLLYVKVPQGMNTIQLFDALGRTVFQSTESETILDLGNIDRGVYILQVRSGDKAAFRRIIKK